MTSNRNSNSYRNRDSNENGNNLNTTQYSSNNVISSNRSEVNV